MDSEDTVMSKDYMKTFILATHCSPETTARDIVITDIEQDLVYEQAVLSFDAGMREVVDWMKENITWDWPNDQLLFSSKLKEWGL